MTIKINGDNSVANPGFTGADTDTGLQVGTDELKLVTGGSEKVTVNDSIVIVNYDENTDARFEIRSGTNSSRKALITKKTDAAGGALLIQSSRGNTSRQIGFITDNSGTEKVSILADGGITFNGDTAAANALDDYEEGTWTPTFSGNTTAGSYTFTFNSYYTKIGNMVTAYALLSNIATTTVGSGYLAIGGLPFTGTNKNSLGSVVFDKFNLDSNACNVTAVMVANTNTLQFRETRDSSTDTTVAVTEKTSDGSDIFVQISYQVA